MIDAAYGEWLARGVAHQRAGATIDAMLCFRQALSVNRHAVLALAVASRAALRAAAGHPDRDPDPASRFRDRQLLRPDGAGRHSEADHPDRIAAEVTSIFADRALREARGSGHGRGRGSDPASFTARVVAETQMWREVVAKQGLKLE